jgi:hypothetical protein
VAKVKSLVFQARSSLIETRRARDIPCSEIREQLATATGGALRRGPLRRHLRACTGCAEFRDDVTRQRRALAAILPVVPTLGLKKSALAAIGLGGGGAGGTAAGVGVGAGGGIAVASSGAAVKLAAAVAVAGLAVGGGVMLNHGSPAPAAQAADDHPGGQAWPAPPAGTGPGPRLQSIARGRPAHSRARPKRVTHDRSASGRQVRVAAPRPHRSGGRTQPPRSSDSTRRDPTPTTVQPQPAQAPAATPAAPSQPQPASTGGGHPGGPHTNNGNHTGWEHSSHGGQGHDEHGGGGGDQQGGGGQQGD